MISMSRIIFVLMASCLFMPSSAFAKTAVWKASKDGNVVYLGGTVHLLSEVDYPLPKGFEKAYKKSQEIVLEADVSSTSDLSFQIKSLEVMTFQDHRSLSTVLDRKTYQAFSGLLNAKGIPIAVFEKFTPAGATLALTAIEMQKMGMVESLGVDKHFLMRAKADQKQTHYLETLDEQLGFIESMNSLDPNKLIQASIKEMNGIGEKMSSMLDAWKSGDLVDLEDVGIKEMQRDFPNMYQFMLVQRNNAWIKEINGFIESPEVEFLLVGALHMAGDDGLVAQLKSLGYRVEQLD